MLLASLPSCLSGHHDFALRGGRLCLPGVRKHSHGVRRGSTDGSFSGFFSSFGVAHDRVSFHEKGGSGGSSLQQDCKFCCLSCGTVHDCFDPLGLSAIDEVQGFGFRVFSSGVRVLVSSSGVSLLLFVFLSGTRTRFCFLATDFFQTSTSRSVSSRHRPSKASGRTRSLV